MAASSRVAGGRRADDQVEPTSMEAGRLMESGAEMTGVLNVNKPRGMSSRGVVDRVVKLTGRRKAGHGGTLDPLATGVLLVCIGPATRLVERAHRLPKSYRTIVRLGARSDTLDADGEIVATEGARPPALSDVEAAVAPWVGEVEQAPPAHSALKVQGRRAYALARAGETVELAPRRVRIDRIAVARYEWPHVELHVDCGSGTYIRSLARDVGEALGTGGLVDVLVRTRIGPFALEDAVDLDQLTAESIAAHLWPALALVPDLPRRFLDARQAADIAQGRPIADVSSDEEASEAAGSASNLGPGPRELALVGPDGRALAIAELDPAARLIRPRKVLK